MESESDLSEGETDDASDLDTFILGTEIGASGIGGNLTSVFNDC